MKKRGQVTVFIIVALIVVGIVVLPLFLKFYIRGEDFTKSSKIKTDLDEESKNLNNFITNCLYSVGNESLEKVAEQGGYYNKPRYYLNVKNESFYSYYIYQGEVLDLKFDNISKEISLYIDDNILKCINRYQGSRNIQINYGIPKTNIVIESKRVTFNLVIPVRLEKENVSEELDKFKAYINSKIQDMIDMTKYIGDSYENDTKILCITCLSDFAEKKEVYVEMSRYENGTDIIRISQNGSSSPKLFQFLNKYAKNEK